MHPGGGVAPSRPAIACLSLVFPAVGIFRGVDIDLFTIFPIAMSAVAGLPALGGALTLPVQPLH